LTKELRKQLPSPYIITHGKDISDDSLLQLKYLSSRTAPVAPWFTTDTKQYPKGMYSYLSQSSIIGDLIDFYNIQFYNQPNCYLECTVSLHRTFDGQQVVK